MTDEKDKHISEQEEVAVLESSSSPDFEWDDEQGYSREERQKLEDFYESTISELNENEIVEGTVVSFDDRVAVVNIGFKSEGIIPIAEFRDIEELEKGTKVDVYVKSKEDQEGQLDLSRRMAKSLKTWKRINEAMEEDLVMEGHVKRRTKGGFVVDLQGIEAFLPGSQIDVKPIRDYDAYVGKTMDFKVVKINKQQHNVVISHKALIEKDLEKQRQEILNNLERGQVLEGTVKNITNFGVFIDLGGVDGLLHITDISWGRINSPEEVLSLDEKVNVVVLDFDEEKKRISLGLKQLQPHPWDNLPENIEVGAKVEGKVVTIADYGIFIEVLPGVEGLIHVSEMSWSQHPKNPNELYEIGQMVEAVVLTLDREERKMSLGIKQLTEDPWTHVATKYPVGSKHTGIVRNITNYGCFVELEEGVDGLIHVQDFSWMRKINHPSEFVEKDQELDVVVLELDEENRKIRLGHKQLEEDPWEKLESVFPIDSNHEGTITRITEKGAIVELEYGLEGYVPAKHLKTESGQELKEGDSATFKVIEFNKDLKKIVLSHTKTWKADEPMGEITKKKATKKKKPSAAPSSGGSAQDKDTLGDFAALAELKEKMNDGGSTPAQPQAEEPSEEETKAPAPSVEEEEEEKAD